MSFKVRLKYLSLIRLYSEINKLEESIRSGESIDFNLVKRIAKKLRSFDILENGVSHTLLWAFPFAIFLEEEKFFKKKKSLIRFLRTSLEKVIMERNKALWDRGNKESFERIMRFDLPLPLEDLIRGFEYIEGKKPVLLTTPHAQAPLQDAFVEEFVKRVARKTAAYALISRLSRVYIDYNRKIARVTPFRRIIERLSLVEKKIKLILDIHSTSNTESEHDVEIGIFGGLSVSRRYVVKLFEKLVEYGLRPVIEKKYVGGDIIRYHSFPPFVNAIQLEFIDFSRAKKRKAAEKALIDYILSLKF
ncbi:MAG: hypothetical protein ACTSUJ_04005 [Candidatus Njordarchaeales archaeon]